MFRAFLNSPSLRAALALGCGGIAFTLCNLVFARELSSSEYGLFSLFIGILSVAMLAAPLGLDLVVARHGVPLESGMRRATLVTSAATGVLTASIATLAYHLTPALCITLAIATAAAGACQAGVAHFQGQRQLGIAAWLLQIPNMALVPIAVLTMLLRLKTASTLSMLLATVSVVGLAGTWHLVVRTTREGGEGPRVAALWREALSLVTITMASAIFMQLERLVLPPIVGVRGLALFGVLASLVGSPFRMIQSAVLFTLIPGLRAAHDVSTRRRLLAREVLIVTATLACGAVVIWRVAPPIAHGFLGGRYELSDALMCAAIVSGVLKVCSAFATAIVVSLGDEKDLRRAGVSAWISVGVACLGAFLTAPWGLTGVLYGISAGWLVRTLIAAWLAVPHLLQSRGDLPYPVR